MLTFSSLRARFLVRPLVSCRKACCLIRLDVMSSLCNVRFTLRNSAKLSHPSSPRPFQDRSSSLSVKFVYTTPKNEKELIWNRSNTFIGIYNTSDFFIARITIYYRWLLIKYLIRLYPENGSQDRLETAEEEMRSWESGKSYS